MDCPYMLFPMFPCDPKFFQFPISQELLMQPPDLATLAPGAFQGMPLLPFGVPEVSEGERRLPMDTLLQKPFMSLKKIGPLTIEERNQKIQRFREKRARRQFAKKISYACRKTVADGRVRVKGRFITKAEAAKLKELQASSE